MNTRLIFVRHAEAEGNYKRIFQGWTNGDITDKGHLQAERVAERLKDFHIDVLYSSSLNRTMQTASYISKAKGLPIIRTDKLWEINGGDWEGEHWDVLTEKWPLEYNTWEKSPHLHKMPNGESMGEFQERLIDEIKYIINNNKGKNICIVTHGTAIRTLICYFRGCDLEEMLNVYWCDNTALTIVDYKDEKFKTVIEGDATHLGSELATIQNQHWWEEYIKSIQGGEQAD